MVSMAWMRGGSVDENEKSLKQEKIRADVNQQQPSRNTVQGRRSCTTNPPSRCRRCVGYIRKRGGTTVDRARLLGGIFFSMGESYG